MFIVRELTINAKMIHNSNGCIFLLCMPKNNADDSNHSSKTTQQHSGYQEYIQGDDI